MSTIDPVPETESPFHQLGKWLLVVFGFLLVSLVGLGLYLHTKEPPPLTRTEALLKEARDGASANGRSGWSLFRGFGGGNFPRGEYEIVQDLKKLGDEALDTLMTAVADKTEVPDVRAVAAKALAEIGAKQAVPALMTAVASNDSRVAIAAAEALGRFGDPQAVPALIAALADMSRRAHEKAANTLGDLGDARAAPEAVIEALGKIGDARAAPALTAALADPNSRTRAKAADALGNLGDAQAVPALTTLLKDADSASRSAAVGALGKIGDTQAVPALLTALDDATADVRAKAAEALGNVGDTQAVGPLLARLADGDKAVRQRAATALGDIGDAQAVPALLEILKGEDREACAGAARALGHIGDPRARAALEEALGSNVDPVRGNAAHALADLGDPQSGPALLAALSKCKADDRFWIVVALGTCGHTPASPRLEEVLKDRGEKNASARFVAAFSLALLKQPQAVPVLAETLTGKADWMALGAVGGLSHLGTPEAREALKAGAPKIQRPDIRGVAERTMATSLVAALGEEIRSNQSKVAFNAVCILEYVNDPAALPALDEAAKIGKSQVRSAARLAARRIRRLQTPQPAAPAPPPQTP